MKISILILGTSLICHYSLAEDKPAYRIINGPDQKTIEEELVCSVQLLPKKELQSANSGPHKKYVEQSNKAQVLKEFVTVGKIEGDLNKALDESCKTRISECEKAQSEIKESTFCRISIRVSACTLFNEKLDAVSYFYDSGMACIKRQELKTGFKEWIDKNRPVVEGSPKLIEEPKTEEKPTVAPAEEKKVTQPSQSPQRQQWRVQPPVRQPKNPNGGYKDINSEVFGNK